MALVLADRVKVRARTTGTGTFTLESSVQGYQGFDAVGDGNETYYGIIDNSGNWEIGRGTYSTDSTVQFLSRDSIISSSNNDALVDFPAGSKNVFCTFPSSIATSLANEINLSAINQDILPSIDSNGTTGYSLGSASYKWKELFVSTGSIYIGDVKLSNVAGKITARKILNLGTELEEEALEDGDAFSDIRRASIVTSTPTPGTPPLGTITSMAVSPSNNPLWDNGANFNFSGINAIISVDGSGNATVTSVPDGDTGHFVGETFGPYPGIILRTDPPRGDFGEEFSLVVTAIDSGNVTALDLTKQVQIITATGSTQNYSLADGSDGQIMYFVPDSAIDTSVYIKVANARILDTGGTGFPTSVTDYSWQVFGDTEAPRTISTAIFADGAWCLTGGVSD